MTQERREERNEQVKRGSKEKQKRWTAIAAGLLDLVSILKCDYQRVAERTNEM